MVLMGRTVYSEYENHMINDHVMIMCHFISFSV